MECMFPVSFSGVLDVEAKMMESGMEEQGRECVEGPFDVLRKWLTRVSGICYE